MNRVLFNEIESNACFCGVSVYDRSSFYNDANYQPAPSVRVAVYCNNGLTSLIIVIILHCCIPDASLALNTRIAVSSQSFNKYLVMFLCCVLFVLCALKFYQKSNLLLCFRLSRLLCMVGVSCLFRD